MGYPWVLQLPIGRRGTLSPKSEAHPQDE